MKKDSKSKQFSRHKFLAALGGISLLPLVSRAEAVEKINPENEEYDILLKPDGSTVKVKKGVLNKSKTVKNKMDNPTMKKWLKK